MLNNYELIWRVIISHWKEGDICHYSSVRETLLNFIGHSVLLRRIISQDRTYICLTLSMHNIHSIGSNIRLFWSSLKWGKSDRSHICPAGPTVRWIWQTLLQWWFVYPDTFVPGWYFRINEFSGLLNRPLVQTWKSVPNFLSRLARFPDYRSPD